MRLGVFELSRIEIIMSPVGDPGVIHGRQSGDIMVPYREVEKVTKTRQMFRLSPLLVLVWRIIYRVS